MQISTTTNSCCAFVFCLLMTILTFVSSHVVLRFPPARYPPLDFLDNVRTEAPCGVPRLNTSTFTTLESGRSYLIVWQLNYVHKGGFNIDLLNGDGKQIHSFTGTAASDEFIGNGNTSIHSYEIKIPEELECQYCVLRLQRQAQEWGTYKFWSCADVNVINRQSIKKNSEVPITCFGRIENETCLCSPVQSGEFCQFQDDCANDGYCGGVSRGTCVTLATDLHPRRVCYCKYPYFGKYCQLEFTPSKDDLQSACFNYSFVSENLTNLPSSVSKDATTAALFNADCYNQLRLTSDHRIYWRVLQDVFEMILEFRSKSWIAVGWRPIDIDGSCQISYENPDKFATADNNKIPASSSSLAASKTATLHTSPIVFETLGRNTNHSDNSHYTPTYDVLTHVLKRENSNSKSSSASLHPMDCTDIVFGSAMGKTSRIVDMYTRDRSTPLEDAVYGGRDDLRAAVGLESGDFSIVMFRKPLTSSETTDHTFGDKLHFIWATGQPFGDSSADLYPRDVFKYHGTTRGQTELVTRPVQSAGTELENAQNSDPSTTNRRTSTAERQQSNVGISTNETSSSSSASVSEQRTLLLGTVCSILALTYYMFTRH